MVAETSAWGRAIVAATGAETKNNGKIASADEVNARQKPQEAPTGDWIAQANELSFSGDKEALRALYGSAVKSKASPDILDAIKAIGEAVK
jgi:hypothetical protein